MYDIDETQQNYYTDKIIEYIEHQESIILNINQEKSKEKLESVLRKEEFENVDDNEIFDKINQIKENKLDHGTEDIIASRMTLLYQSGSTKMIKDLLEQNRRMEDNIRSKQR